MPSLLYVDNGAAYRARRLALVCAKLGVTLIHARPYHPQAKGKTERLSLTCRTQLLRSLVDDTRSVEAMNRRLRTWLEDEYHVTPASGRRARTPA